MYIDVDYGFLCFSGVGCRLYSHLGVFRVVDVTVLLAGALIDHFYQVLQILGSAGAGTFDRSMVLLLDNRAIDDSSIDRLVMDDRWLTYDRSMVGC